MVRFILAVAVFFLTFAGIVKARSANGTNNGNVDQGAPSPAVNTESTGSKIVIALLTAILTIAGAAIGTAVTFEYQRTKWLEETDYTYEQTLFNKRLELLERTSRVFTKANAAKVIELNLRAVIDGVLEMPPVPELVDLRLKRDDIDQEYSTLMTLNGIYFGPKTRQAVEDLVIAGGVNWLNANAEQQSLLTAMWQELKLDLDTFPPRGADGQPTEGSSTLLFPTLTPPSPSVTAAPSR